MSTMQAMWSTTPCADWHLCYSRPRKQGCAAAISLAAAATALPSAALQSILEANLKGAHQQLSYSCFDRF